MAAFTLDNILKDGNQKKEKKIQAPKIQMIHYTKLLKSDGQFYSENDIEKLSDALLLGNGIRQPLEVKKINIGEYEIIAGH